MGHTRVAGPMYLNVPPVRLFGGIKPVLYGAVGGSVLEEWPLRRSLCSRGLLRDLDLAFSQTQSTFRWLVHTHIYIYIYIYDGFVHVIQSP